MRRGDIMKQFFFIFAVLIWASYTSGAQSIELVRESNGFRHLPSSVLFPFHQELTQCPMTFDDITKSRIDFGVPSYDDYTQLRRVVGMEYSHATIPLEIRLYVYPALHSLEDEFTYAVNHIYSVLDPQSLHAKPRMSVESALEIRGYAQEFRYTEYLREERQVLISTLEVYQHSGWFVKVRMTVSHDYAQDGRRLVRELLDIMVWPQPIRSLPITFSYDRHTLSYQGEDYTDPFFCSYLPLIRMLQEEPGLSDETFETLAKYEKQARRSKRSLTLWAPVFFCVVPIAPLVYIAAVEPGDHPLRDRPIAEYSTGSKIAFGVFCSSWLIGCGLMLYSVAADPGYPFRELGLVNRDLMGSR
jgi:hypothetical protein